jgi:Transposase DDE domain
MIEQDTLLVTLVKLVDRVPRPPLPARDRRGRPPTYPDRLFLQALVIMIVRHLHTVHALLSVLAQPTPEMQRLRAVLTVDGRFPTRRTWERRLHTIPATLPAQMGCLGRALVVMIQPWATCGRAAAIDSTLLRARGGVWHKKDREAGIVPHTSIDTEAHWSKSGWHGWVYGWKLHLVTTVAGVWIPLAADLTAANVADNVHALTLLPELPVEVRYGLGDQHDHDPVIDAVCGQADQTVVATRHGPYPHTDDGVGVRRILHELRSHAIENLNEQFKGIFDVHGQVPTKGLVNTRRFALGAVFVYQLTLWYRHEHGLDLRVGLKPFLKAA